MVIERGDDFNDDDSDGRRRGSIKEEGFFDFKRRKLYDEREQNIAAAENVLRSRD